MIRNASFAGISNSSRTRTPLPVWNHTVTGRAYPPANLPEARAVISFRCCHLPLRDRSLKLSVIPNNGTRVLEIEVVRAVHCEIIRV